MRLSLEKRRIITDANVTYSKSGMYHPDRVMHAFDLLYLDTGNWTICENNISYTLEPHDLLLLEPRKHHYSISPCAPGTRTTYIHFNVLRGDLTQNASLELPKLLNCMGNPRIHTLMEQLVTLYHAEECPLKAIKLSDLLELLLIEISESQNNLAPKDLLVEQILSIIHQNPERFFSQEELASLSNCSVRTLTSHFKAVTGMALHSYQVEQKLTVIHDLLRAEQKRTLKDIAMSFGFYDEYQLSKLYKKKYGITPSERRGRSSS